MMRVKFAAIHTIGITTRKMRTQTNRRLLGFGGGSSAPAKPFTAAA